MRLRRPISTRTDTLSPYTTLCRSFVAVNLYARRRGGEIGSPLELGIAADLDRSPPVFLREPDQIGKGVWVFRLDAIRRDGRERLFVVRASIELVANPEEPRVQLGGHFHRTPAACLVFLYFSCSFVIPTHLNDHCTIGIDSCWVQGCSYFLISVGAVS